MAGLARGGGVPVFGALPAGPRSPWQDAAVVRAEPFLSGRARLVLPRNPAGWARLARATLRRLPLHRPAPARAGRSVQIVASPTAAAMVGVTAAQALGARLTIAQASLGRAAAAHARRGLQVLLIAERDQLTDDVLDAVLEEGRRFAASWRPWAERPSVSLITGEGVEETAQAAAKAVCTLLSPAAPGTGHTFASYVARGEGVRIVRLRRAGGPPLFDETLADRQDALRSLHAGAEVMAYEAHGADACAKGGAGIVLCGKSSQCEPRGERTAGGRLACGAGHPCPRGPVPFPLEKLDCNVLLLAACNGLRLADSSHAPDFNLGLSFLRGRGAGYAASTSAALVGEPTTGLFLAAMAAGRGLDEATALLNAFAHCTSFDRPSFFAAGAWPEASHRDPEAFVHSGQGHHWDVRTAPTTLLEVVLDDARAISLARRAALAWEVGTGDAGAAPCVFHRLERVGGRTALRVFVFRFPQPFDAVHLVARDRRRLCTAATDAVQGLQSWLETVRLAGLAKEDAYAVLADRATAMRQELVPVLGVLSFDGRAVPALEAWTNRTTSLAALARDLYLTDAMPRLAGPYYLTNVLAPSYHYEASWPAACPVCARPAAVKRHRHPIEGWVRLAAVCPRCGAVSDLAEGGRIRRLTVHLASTALPGADLDVTVRARLAAAEGEPLAACARVSRHNMADLVPRPERIDAEAHGATATFRFRIALPDHALPHQHFVRALVASPTELAFAQRMFWIDPPQSA